MASWIFQYDPDKRNRYSLVLTLAHGPRENWTVKQHRGAIAANDTVYIWRTGDYPALIASAVVDDEPKDRGENPFGRYGVDLTFQHWFQRPIAKVELLNDPVLSQVRVFNGFPGTNFDLTEQQAARVAEVAQDRTVPISTTPRIPPDPNWTLRRGDTIV